MREDLVQHIRAAVMRDLVICATYDDNFEPLCSQFCSNFRDQPGIKIRLNKISTEGDSKFGSEVWYENLRQKMRFLERCMRDINEGDVICCSDTDIQFFKPRSVLSVKFVMESTDMEYMGQREHTSDEFNGGFFLIKKNNKTMAMVETINSNEISNYKYAEQKLINELIGLLGVRSGFLDPKKYFHGCLRKNEEYMSAKVLKRMVMHHATCAYDLDQKMRQMNFVREAMGVELIEWSDYTGFKE